MTSKGVCVRIYERDECVYENSVDDSNVGELPGLIGHLRDTQIKINDFLTGLVDKQQDLGDAPNRPTSGSESEDSAEEIEVNPKKCKLIN